MIEKYLQNLTPRKYQQEIFENCKTNNCLVVLPTGIGKTLIALMLTIQRFIEFPREKVLILAPTKPLAEQHYNYFKKNLPELFGEITLFTGKVKAENRKKIWQSSDIIFSTPQCIANDIKKGLYNLTDVSLLVEDEAHRCLKKYDYRYVAENYIQNSQHPRILGMTASPGSDKKKIQEICKNLFVDHVEVRTRESEDVKEYLQEREFDHIDVELPPEFLEIKKLLEVLFNRKTDELRNRKVLFQPATGTNLIALQQRLFKMVSTGKRDFNTLIAMSVVAQAVKINHALGLIETQTVTGFQNYLDKLFEEANTGKSKASKHLANSLELNKANVLSKDLLARNIEHPKMEKLKEIIQNDLKENPNMKSIVFSQFRDSVNIIAKRLNEIPGIKAEVFVGQQKKNGSGMDQKKQGSTIVDFSEGKINVLCATSIGEEGLDIPEVNSVIFYEPVPSAIRKIQRAGRTARLMKGKFIILVTKNTRDEAFYWTAISKEKRMHKALKTINADLEEIKSNKTLEDFGKGENN